MIRSVRAFHIGGAVPPEVASARGAFAEREGVLLEVGDDSGGFAFGEASPLPGFSRESLAEVSSRVVAFSWASLAFPASVDDLADLDISEPSLRFAVEHTLLSLLARRARTTVAELLSSRAASKLATSVLVGAAGDDKLLARASHAAARGASSVKVKVGGRAELAALRPRLERLREAVGPSLEIRLDFNGTLADLTRREIVDALGALTQSNVAFVEEPWSGQHLLELGELPVPWFADESLADPSLQSALLACPSVGGFVLKPSLLGLLGAFRVGASSGLRQVVVSHVFEGSVALEACGDLALALAGVATARAPGLDRHAALASFDLPPPPAFASARAEVQRVAFDERGAFFDAVRERIARERPFFEWTA